jgi:hypothetical protein
MFGEKGGIDEAKVGTLETTSITFNDSFPFEKVFE